MVSCKNNAAATDNLFSTYYVLTNILFDYLKAYHEISLEPEVEQMLMLLKFVIPLNDLPSLNVKTLTSNHILDKESGPIYDEHELTLKHEGKTRDRVLQKKIQIPLGYSKKLCNTQEGRHLLTENGSAWIHLEFSYHCLHLTFFILS